MHCPTRRIYGFDPNPAPRDTSLVLFEQEYSLESWLQAWIRGIIIWRRLDDPQSALLDLEADLPFPR